LTKSIALVKKNKNEAMKHYCQAGVLIMLMLGSYQAISQDKFVTFYGKVMDAQSRQAIPFASIQVKGSSIGTACNAEGEFVFKVREKRVTDTLLISCVGYKTVARALEENGSTIMIILLEPATVELAEITVNAPVGLDILKKALAKIPENYDTSDFHMTAFYRENVGLEDFELTYNEAVLDILKTFKVEEGTMNDQIRVLKGRKKKIDYSSDFQLYLWIKNFSNGARSSLGEDLVKYRTHKFSPFNSRNFRYYDFNVAEVIQNGDRNLVVIEVLPKKNTRKAFFNMKIFVDEASFAIVRYDWDLTKAGVDYVERKDKGFPQAIMSMVIGATVDYQKFQATITYQEYKGKWYLSSVGRRLEMLINSKKRKMVDRLWHGDMNLQVTDIDTQDQRAIATGNIGNSEASVESLMGNDYDEAFWEDFNIVKPVIADSLKAYSDERLESDPVKITKPVASNRQNGFTRGDTLRGKLTPLRTCYDVTFYHLDVTVDMDQRSVKGSNMIRFKVERPFSSMQVDLFANMKIDKILYKNKQLSYTREYDAVFIHFPEELRQGILSEIEIHYEGVPKVPDRSIPMNGGVLWDRDSLGNPWAQMVCQGSGASLWWPNKDHLSDEPDSMKIWITVPAAFTEVSNGRLIRKTSLPNKQIRYEWFVSYPINNYNVTFNIGKYAHYTDRYINGDTLTIDYYVMPYNLDRSKVMFKQVKPMLGCFEKNFGKYPFVRDGFTLVESLYPMEHQSGVCIGRITQQNFVETNPLLWHESAHEWWGNAISCKDLADMWIHEAFATYAESLVVECMYGKEAAQEYINDHQSRVRNKEPVIGVYDVNHIFYDIGDMYEKGMLMLNTFRSVLDNDTIWFSLLRNIQQHFRYQTLTSDDLVRYIGQQTRTDYAYFFDQYLKHPGLPTLETELKEQGSNLIVKYRWQADVPGFRMPVKGTIAPGHFDFIYPATAWKTITLKNMTASDFEVDEDSFFVRVVEVE
jgi:hypothetical protein